MQGKLIAILDGYQFLMFNKESTLLSNSTQLTDSIPTKGQHLLFRHTSKQLADFQQRMKTYEHIIKLDLLIPYNRTAPSSRVLIAVEIQPQ